MTNRHLEYFLKVYEERSIKKAADALFITPQGVSRTILELEHELEMMLFIRDGTSMIPTDQADFLHEHAEKIVNEFYLIKGKKFLNKRKKLSVLVSYDIFELLGVDFLFKFKETYPDVILSIINTSDKDAVGRINRLEADAAIITGPVKAENLCINYLFTRYYNVIVNKSNKLASKRSIDYEDLQNYPVALCGGFEQGAYAPNDNEVLKTGAYVNIIFETLNYNLVLDAVRDNRAIGIVPDFFTNGMKDNKILILPFSKANSADYYIIYNNESKLKSDSETFCRFLLDWCKKHSINEIVDGL